MTTSDQWNMADNVPVYETNELRRMYVKIDGPTRVVEAIDYEQLLSHFSQAVDLLIESQSFPTNKILEQKIYSFLDNLLNSAAFD